MSYSHFVKLNESQLKADFDDTTAWNNFLGSVSMIVPSNFNTALEHIRSHFNTSPIEMEYWLHKFNKYTEMSRGCSYPMIFSTTNLVTAFEQEVYNMEGGLVEDTMYFYYPSFTLEFQLITEMNGTISDGYQIEVIWNVRKGTEQQVDEFLHLINKNDEIDRLTEQNELLRLLDHESWIQKELIKPIFTNLE